MGFCLIGPVAEVFLALKFGITEPLVETPISSKWVPSLAVAQFSPSSSFESFGSGSKITRAQIDLA